MIKLGDCLEGLRALPDNSVDSIVTDPPYGLKFMGKAWDYDVPPEEVWRECLRVLKPGGHLLCFAGTRTQHRMAVRIEDAGFEIRDMIAWVYGSGFPKSLDVSKAIDKARRRDFVTAAVRLGMTIPGRNLDDWTKEGHAPGDKWWAEFRAHLPAEDWRALEREVVGAGKSGAASVAYVREAAAEYDVTAPATPDAERWQGWGTALKPALEPITVARKPLIGTVAANVLAHGTGALNIDGCRVGVSPDDDIHAKNPNTMGGFGHAGASVYGNSAGAPAYNPAAGRWPANLIHDGSDEVVALFPEQKSPAPYARSTDDPTEYRGLTGTIRKKGEIVPGFGDSGSAARFFYCAKASKKDRGDGNTHPTVKPTDLMRYLCRLVTPPGGLVLDPYTGSGSTAKAAALEGFRFIGFEIDPDYHAIAERRWLAAIGELA